MKKPLIISLPLISVLGIGTSSAFTVLADIQNASGGIASTAADFAVGDSSVEAGTSVDLVTASGSSVALSGGMTIAMASGGGPFNTNKGPTNDVAILDGYVFYFGGAEKIYTLSGLSSLPAGIDFRVTLWGAGDLNDVASAPTSAFTVTYNGVTSGPANTSANPGSAAPLPYTGFTLTKVDGVDTLDIGFNSAGGGAGFNGFSVTGVPEPSTALLGLLGFSFVLRRRR